MTTVAFYALYGILNVAAVMLLKANLHDAVPALRHVHVFTRPVGLLALGALLYASSFLCWMVILNRSSVGRAYPIAIGITMALTTLGAVVVLKERMTVGQVVGIVVVFVGVTLLARAT